MVTRVLVGKMRLMCSVFGRGHTGRQIKSRRPFWGGWHATAKTSVPGRAMASLPSLLLLLLLHLNTAVFANSGSSGHSFTYFGPNFGTPGWSPAPVTAAPRADFASPTWATFSVNPFSNAVTSNPWKPLPAISFVPEKSEVKSVASSAEYPSYTQGPVNSAIPWAGYTSTTRPTTKATTKKPQTTTTEYQYQFTELEDGEHKNCMNGSKLTHSYLFRPPKGVVRFL